jgi:hypothetical protein
VTGSGTQADPYKIYTLDDLNNMRNNLTAYYELANDIDATPTLNWNSAAGWLPIYNFNGNFDGKYYKIKSLFINRPTTDQIGLFSYVTNGSADILIQNVVLDNVNITGANYTGAICGNMFATNARTITFNKCCASGIINGNNYTGGLIGYGSLDIWDTGGFYYVLNCYSMCTISTSINTNYIGGIVGYAYRANDLSNCYFVGLLKNSTQAGGITATTNGNHSNNFYNSNCDATLVPQTGYTPKTTTEMKIQSTYTSWDFTNIWGINPSINSGYPYLKYTGGSTMKIVRIKNNGGIVIAGELIEGNSTLQIDPSGNLKVDSFEEGNNLSFGNISYNQWTASTAICKDDCITPTTSKKNGHLYKCTVAGTTSTTEPTWPTTFGATVTDNTVTWKEIGSSDGGGNDIEVVDFEEGATIS